MTITTLNISSSAIKYLVLKGSEAVKHGSMPPAGTIKNGSVLQPELITGQLKSLITAKKLSTSGVIISINGLPFSYRLFTLPKMEPETFIEALLRMARREMPIDPAEMYITWQAYPSGSDEWQVLVSGVSRQPVDSLMAVLFKAGIRPSCLDLQPLAIARLAIQKDAVIVDLEKDCSNIVIVAQGVPVAMQIVPALGPEADWQDEVRQVTGGLNKMVEFYNGTHTRQPVPETAKVLLTGELADDSRAVKLFQEEVAYPVELLAAVAGVFSGLPLHGYAANAGAALANTVTVRDAAGGVAPGHQINLGNIARERKTHEKKAQILPRLAVPLAVIAGIGAMIPFYNSRSDLQASLAQVQAELTQANTQYNQAVAKANDAKALEDSVSEVQANTQKIVTANQAILTRTDFVSDIMFIIKALPAGVSYTSISIDADALSIAGDASTAAPVVQFAHNLEAAGGYTKANISWINKPHAEAAGVAVSFQIVISR